MPRPGYLEPRFTAQLVVLDTPDIKRRIVELATRRGISQAELLREIIALGLPELERQQQHRAA